MRIALFGAGRIGPLHARNLFATGAVESLAIVDLVPERAASLAGDVGASVVTEAAEALTGADAVVIAASTDAHAELIRTALRTGLPIFCEKPLAATLADSIAVRRDIEAAGSPFQLGFQRRFDPAYVEARRLIATGAMGDLHLISLASHDPEPAAEAFIATSGGMFRDLSIHDLDILRFLSGGEVAEVVAMGSSLGFPVYERYADHANAVACLRLLDGTPVALSAARQDPLGHDVRTEVFGTLDSISVGVGPRMPLRSVEPGVPPPAGPPWHIFLDRWDVAYRDEMLAFLEVAAGRLASPCTARDGVEALRIAEALTISAREHRLVPMSEIPER